MGESQSRFRKRNLATGVSTSEARRQEAMYDEALQAMRNTGMEDTARIREEGAMERIMAAQEFDAPLRETQVEAGRLGNEAIRFANVMGGKYGERAIRGKLDMSPIVPRANVYFPERGPSAEEALKTDASSVRAPDAPHRTVPGAAPGGLMQKWSRAWDRSSRTPVGKVLGLPAVNYLTQKGFEGLDAVGKGVESIYRKAFTPTDDTPALPERIGAPPPASNPFPFGRSVPRKKKKKFTWRDNY